MNARTGSSASQRSGKPVSIRFSAEEKRAIEQAAERDGLAFSAWIRKLALYACTKNLRVTESYDIKRAYRKAATTTE